MRRAALILAVILAPGGPALAEPWPPRDAVASFEGRPVVERPPKGTCFDPKNRQLCKAECAAAFAACGSARSACDAAQAACVAQCPPMLCSRGRSTDPNPR